MNTEKMRMKRNLFVLGGLYLFAWLCILFDRFSPYILGNQFEGNNIPVWLIYVLVAFPFVFFAFLILFWGLNSFFSFLFRTMSFVSFFLFCLLLWIVWSFVNTLACIWLQNSMLWNGWGFMIPIVFMCIIAAYAGVQVRYYYIYTLIIQGRSLLCYWLIHYSLYVLSTGFIIVLHSVDIFNSTGNKKVELFIIFLITQCFIYSVTSIFSWIWMRF